MTAIRRIDGRVVYENAWLTVTEDVIQYADGTSGIYGVVHKPDFAVVIPIEGDRVHLVEQYRYPVGGRYWEFPQGALRDGQPHMAFGTPGGDQQDQWTLQFFLNVVEFGMDLQEAADAPTFHTDHLPSSFYPRPANRPSGLRLAVASPG